MIDSVFTALSGLQGHQRGLSTISNNVANMNTPGFRGSHVDFTDVFSGGGTGGQPGESTAGGGLNASRVSLDLRAGEIQQTGRELDLALHGDGYFVVRDKAGALRYTRNGAFEFNDEGVLVGRGHEMAVMARDAAGNLSQIALAGLRNSPPSATTQVLLSGNLTSGSAATGDTTH